MRIRITAYRVRQPPSEVSGAVLVQLILRDVHGIIGKRFRRVSPD
jgi:hypothetical protein